MTKLIPVSVGQRQTAKLSFLSQPARFSQAKRFACVFATALLLGHSAHAATSTWTNVGGGDWSTPGNWSGTDTPPVAADTALFNAGAGTSIAVTNTSAHSVTNISFDTSAGSYTIGTTSGGALTLGSGGTTQILSTLTATNAIETINAPIILGGNYTFANNSANGTGVGAGTLDFGGAITSAATTGTTTLTLSGSNTNANTISGVISNGTGTNSVAINDQGTWVLSGNNTFKGGITVSGTGTLDINASGTSSTNSAIGTGSLVINSGGTIDNTSGAPVTIGTNNAITFSNFTFGGSNNLTLSGDVTITNNNTVTLDGTGKTLTLSGTVEPSGTGTNNSLTVNNGGGGSGNTLVIGTYLFGTAAKAQAALWGGSGNITVTGPLQQTFAGNLLTYSGTGTLTLMSGASTYSGTTTITSGTAILGASSTVSSGAITSGPIGTGNLTFGSGTTTVTLEDNGTNITLANSVLDAVNLVLGSTGGGSITFDGSSLTTPATWAMDTNHNLTLTVNNTTTIVDGISGAHNFIENGTGKLVLSGTNVYTGTTTVSSGTVQFAKEVSLYNDTTASWTAANITAASGATLALNVGGAGEFTASDVNTLLTNISVASNSTSGLQAGSKIGFDTTNAAGGVFTQGNVIANSTGASGGAIGVTKLGTNTLVLNKANTYTGGTTISTGTLMVSNTSGSATGTGALQLNSGATLTGTGTINSTNITINGTVLVGNGGTTDILHVTASGTTTFSGASLTFNLGSGVTSGQSSQLNMGSTTSVLFNGSSNVLTLNMEGSGLVASGTEYVLFTDTGTGGIGGSAFGGTGLTYNSGTGVISGLTLNFDLNGTPTAAFNGAYLQLVNTGGNTFEIVAVVPEPGTWALMLGGLAVLVAFQRRRRSL